MVAVGHAELGEDVLNVVLSGALGEVELGGDLLVRLSLGHQGGYLQFPR